MVRSSFDPDHAPEVARSTVRYSLYLHDTPADPASLTRLGAAWNHPLILIPANLQTGDAPPRDGYVRVLTPNVVLTALKRADDGKGLIMRLVEMNGEDTEAMVEISPWLLNGLEPALLVDLMERPNGGACHRLSQTLAVPIKANSFATVRFQQEKQ